MSEGIGQKYCINCSADLTFTPASAENKPAFYNINCSTRVRSPFSPAPVELVPVHHALGTIFNFETLEKVAKSKVNFGDQIDMEDDLENESPFKEFYSSASTVPICYVCYLVLSDLYRIYTEFSQLRKSNSFLGSKLKELENQLIDHRSQCQKSQTQKSFSTSGSDPDQVPDSIQHCQCNLNRTNKRTLKNVKVNETFASQNTRTPVNSEFVTPDHGYDHDRELHSDLNLLPGSTVASGSRPSQENDASLNSRKSELTGYNNQDEYQVSCPSVPILPGPFRLKNEFSGQEFFPSSVKFEVALDSEKDPEEILGVTDIQGSSPVVDDTNVLNSSIPSLNFDPNSVLVPTSTAAPNVTGAIKIVSKRKQKRRGLGEPRNILVDQEGYCYLKKHSRQIKGVDRIYWYCDQSKICGASIVEISNEFKAGKKKKYWNEDYTQHASHQANLDGDAFDRKKDEARKSTKKMRKTEPIPLETTARLNPAI